MSVVTINVAAGYEKSIRSVLVAANRKADDRSVALAAGLTGMVGLTVFCSVECTCADTELVQGRFLAGLPSLGLHAHPTPSDSEQSVYHVGGAFSRAPRHETTVRALLQLASDMLCPAVPWLCRSTGVGMAATGLAAYARWLDALARCGRLSERRRNGLVRRSQAWTEVRSLGARFCASVAGARRSDWAKDLRDVSRRMQDEAAELAQVSAAVVGRRPLRSAACIIERAHRQAQHWAPVLCDAALALAGFDQPLRSELSMDDDTAVDAVCLRDLVYLARAGSVPLRALALRRLAFSDDPQAEATLRESVHDADQRVAGTAWWFVNART